MIIKDINGKYELKIDKARKIVFEQLKGSWDVDDFNRFENDYKTKVVTYLGSCKWMKHSDMREYRTSIKITPEMIGRHLEFIQSKGCQGAGGILDSAPLKMQLKRAKKDDKDTLGYFDNEAECDAWLKLQGY